MKRFLPFITAVLLLIGLAAIWRQPTRAQDLYAPPTSADANAGLTIFAARCAACHGDTGLGDGSMAVTAGLAMPNLADPAYRQTADPQQMYHIITNGSLDPPMPPFGPASSNALSEQERWNAVAALFQLSQPTAVVAQGEALFAEWAELGLVLPPVDYWFSRSNAAALADLESGQWGADVSALSQAEKQALVEYGRSQSYQFVDAATPPQTLANATITGLLMNGTTNQPVTNLDVMLRAFDLDLQQTLTQTVMVDDDGRYTFDVADVGADWVYLLTTTYNDLIFNSEPAQIEPTQPTLMMPLQVYDTTTDVSAISIDQIHMIFTFVEGAVQVSELYLFNNDANAVFIGETGELADGVVDLFVPTGAENIQFQRTFGSVQNFTDAPEVVQTAVGWADTLPLRPGQGSSNLLVNYQLPYENGLLLAHPLAYPTAGATAIIPANGVTIEGDGWVLQGEQALSGGSFMAYFNGDLQQATALSLALNGRVQQLVDSSGNALLVRNESQELLIGGVALLVAVVLSVWLWQRWQQPTAVGDGERQQLLQTLAALDDAYADGRVSESRYVAQRQQIKEMLLAIWPRTEEK